MVNVASAMSAGRSFPARARSATSRRCAAISARLRGVCVGDYGGDHAVVHRNGDAHVHVIVKTNAFRSPAGIQSRMLQQHARGQRDQQIRVRDADVVRAFDLRRPLFPIFVERAGFDFTRNEEVRNSSPALRGAFGHQVARECWGLRCWSDFFGAALEATGAAERLACRTRESRRRAQNRARLQCPRPILLPDAAPSEKFSRSELRKVREQPSATGAACDSVVASSCRRGQSADSVFCGRLFAGSHDPGDCLTHGNIGAGLRCDAGENAVGGRFDFHHRFIGFDFEKRLAFGDAVAFFLSPGNELAGFLRHLESGHDNAEGHNVFIRGRLKRTFAPWPSVRNSYALGFRAGFDHFAAPCAGRSFGFARGGQRSVDGEIVRARDQQFFGREARDHFVARSA